MLYANIYKNMGISLTFSRRKEIMSKKITYDSQRIDITCMKEFDSLKYPCRECNREDCSEKEESLLIKKERLK